MVALRRAARSGGGSSRSATAKRPPATVGVNVLETKVAVFMLSAGMAGFAGAFLAQYYETINQAQFTMLGGLPIVLALVIGGVGVGVGRAVRRHLRARPHPHPGDLAPHAVPRARVPRARARRARASSRTRRARSCRSARASRRCCRGARTRKAEAEETKAALADPEVGDLGLDRPFTEADVIILDRGLAITNEVPAADVDPAAVASLIAVALLEIERGLRRVRRPARARRTRRSTSRPARSPGLSGRTARARPRSSTSSPGCNSRRPGVSASTAST